MITKRKILFSCALCLGLAAAVTATDDRGLLFDLAAEGAEYRLTAEQGAVQFVQEGDRMALEITAEAGQPALVRLFPPAGLFWDLRNDAFISFDMENRGDEEAAFRVDTISEYPSAVDLSTGLGALMHLGWLHAGETRQFNCFLVRNEGLNGHLYDIEAFPLMRGKPDKLVLLGWAGLDSTKINEIAVHLPAAPYPRTVRIHRVFRYQSALAESWLTDPGTFFPFIDRYGQYNKADWPGKIHSDQDLHDAREEEDIDLAAHAWPDSFNQYGGFIEGPDYGGTGHFRVQKVFGRWMFIDPDGRAFWSFGVNSTGNTGVGYVDNRRHYFEWLPDEDPEVSRFLSGTMYTVGELNLWRKYGDDYRQIYKERALQRMRSWSLNTLGGWQSTDSGGPMEGKLPYTITINTGPLLSEKIPNPFHPGFRTGVRSALAANPNTWGDPFCIGYFVDNELRWTVNAVFDASLNSADEHAKNAFIDLLRETYATVADLEAAWGMSLGSFEAAAETDPAVIRAMAGNDAGAFYDRFAHTYFRTIDEEIHAVAPDKLYLGCRWNNWNARVISAAAGYVDVFSFNLYRKEILDHAYYGVDKPFISTEFNFGAVDRGKFFPGLGWSSDQRNRGEQAAFYVRSAMDNPLCVGVHWFMWMNTVTWGRFNGENAGMGLVDDADTPYPEIRTAFREIGAGLYEYLTAEEEVSPPRPDPAVFLIEPFAANASTVAMTAATADGSYPPFEYRFEEISGHFGGGGSGWQLVPAFTNSGLLPNTRYTFALTVRDSRGRVGQRSEGVSVTTPSAPPFWLENETLIEETFETALEPENLLSPFPASRWHAASAPKWEREDSSSSLSLVSGSRMRVGWAYDEVVARYFIEVPWDRWSEYVLEGDWEIASTQDLHLGLLAGFAEYDPVTGDLIRRLKSQIIGETNAPFAGQTGSFSIGLTRSELADTGADFSSYVGVFFHHDDDGVLFSQGNDLKSDVYLLDRVTVKRRYGFENEEALIPDGGAAFSGSLRYNRPEREFILMLPGEVIHPWRLYILEHTPDLTRNPWSVEDVHFSGESFDGSELEFICPATEPSGFFRVRVEWAP